MYAGNGETVDVPDAFCAASTAPQVLFPRTPMKFPLKLPPKQKFICFLWSCADTFSFLLKQFCQAPFFREKDMFASIRNPQELVGKGRDALEREGYLCTYPYCGEMYCCAGPLLKECLQNSQYVAILKRWYPQARIPNTLAVVGQQNMSIAILDQYILRQKA